MEVFRHPEPRSRSNESIWHSAWAILPLFLRLASAHAASNPTLNVIISTEIAPPGTTVQIKLSLDKPAAVSSGELALDLDPAVFGPVTAIATFSAAGDACGYATINSSHVDIHFASPSATPPATYSMGRFRCFPQHLISRAPAISVKLTASDEWRWRIPMRRLLINVLLQVRDPAASSR